MNTSCAVFIAEDASIAIDSLGNCFTCFINFFHIAISAALTAACIVAGFAGFVAFSAQIAVINIKTRHAVETDIIDALEAVRSGAGHALVTN